MGQAAKTSLPFTTHSRPESRKAQALIERYRTRGFWTLCHDYVGEPGVSDQEVDIATVQIGGQLRRVSNQAFGAPAWVQELNAEIDKLANTERWLRSRSQFVVAPLLGIPGRTWNDVRREMTGITNLNAVDANGWTVLMYATQLPWPAQEMSSLLRAGSNPNVRSSTNETALTLAVAGGSPEWVRALIGAGADVNARNGNGQTALLAAVHFMGGTPGDMLLEIASILRSAGARTDIRDNAGMTVFTYLDQDVKRSAPYWQGNFAKLRQILEK